MNQETVKAPLPGYNTVSPQYAPPPGKKIDYSEPVIFPIALLKRKFYRM